MSSITQQPRITLPRLKVNNKTDPPFLSAVDVDTFSALVITTGLFNQVYTLPTPTDPTVDRLIYVVHEDDSVGTLEINGIDIQIGSHSTFIWDGDAWHSQEDKASIIDPSQHRALDQLVHNIAETSFEEIIRSGGRVTDVIVWTDVGMTVKIRESNFSYSGNKVITIITKQYDFIGSVVETLTENINYSGNDPIDITRTLT